MNLETMLYPERNVQLYMDRMYDRKQNTNHFKKRLCSFCVRKEHSSEGRFPVGRLTNHHLIPRTKYSERRGPKVPSCERCHRFIHRTFSNEELARRLYTIELLLMNGFVDEHVSWLRCERELPPGFNEEEYRVEAFKAWREKEVPQWVGLG